MKGFILWALFGVFLYLAITAVDMGEYGIAVGLGVFSLGCLWAAPRGAERTKRSKRRAESARW